MKDAALDKFDIGSYAHRALLATGLGLLLAHSMSSMAQERDALQGDRIGYVLTNKFWSIYRGDEAEECPDGYNDGPREQYNKLYPNDGSERTLMETQLAREAEVWFPTLSLEQYPFYDSQGTVAKGLNLDGLIDEKNDYRSPDGVPGIDNQFNRAMRCVAGYGTPDAYMSFFENRVMHDDEFGRIVIELTDVESIENDAQVTLTLYRGMDGLMLDAAGQNFLPYSTQRVDYRWGQEFIYSMEGTIVDGVLTTEPVDIVIPWPVTFSLSGAMIIYEARFELALSKEGATGLLGGYTDIENWYRHSNQGWSTHHQSYGQLSQPSVYRALYRLADGRPDPQTGEFTAISSSVEVDFKQTFIVHPSELSANN